MRTRPDSGAQERFNSPYVIEGVRIQSGQRQPLELRRLTNKVRRATTPIRPGAVTDQADLGLTVVDDFHGRIPVCAKELDAIETYLNQLLDLENINNQPQNLEE